MTVARASRQGRPRKLPKQQGYFGVDALQIAAMSRCAWNHILTVNRSHNRCKETPPDLGLYLASMTFSEETDVQPHRCDEPMTCRRQSTCF